MTHQMMSWHLADDVEMQLAHGGNAMEAQSEAVQVWLLLLLLLHPHVCYILAGHSVANRNDCLIASNTRQ